MKGYNIETVTSYIQPFHLYLVFALLGNITSENGGKLRASDPNGSAVPIDRIIVSDLLSYMAQAVFMEKHSSQPVRILAKKEMLEPSCADVMGPSASRLASRLT